MTTELGAYDRVIRCTPGSKKAGFGFLGVQQEMFCGSNRLCLAVDSTRITSLKYLARNVDASMSALAHRVVDTGKKAILCLLLEIALCGTMGQSELGFHEF